MYFGGTALKGFLHETIVYPILISVNYNYEMSKEGVLGFSIFFLVFEIFKVFDICKLKLN